MADKTGIEWCDATWNPIVGCSIVSPGCTNCYAMKMAGRIEAMAKGAGNETHYAGTTQKTKKGTVWTGKVNLAPDHILDQPLRWQRPRRIFVNSMGDLFHEDIPFEWIDKIFAIMALSPQHQFLVLTKRAARMREYIKDLERRAAEEECDSAAGYLMAYSIDDKHWPKARETFPSWPLPNVWLGVSVERQQEADERIPHLLNTPAAVRFLSCEPLLGRVNFMLTKIKDGFYDVLFGHKLTKNVDKMGFPKIDWVIAGGESGPNARPMHPEWVRSLRDQCQAAGTAFFFKQWGEWLPASTVNRETMTTHSAAKQDLWITADGQTSENFSDNEDAECVAKVGKKAAGRTLDGETYEQFPEVGNG